MKYRFLNLTILIITLLIGCNGFAQEIVSKKITIGIEGGVQFTDISDQHMISDGKTGYNFGAYIEYPLNELVKLRLGLSYDKRAFDLGNVYYVQDTSTGYIGVTSYYAEKVNYNLNYLTIPLSILYVKGNEHFKIYIQGSLYYSLLLNATQDGYTDLYISETDAPYFTNPDWQVAGHQTTVISGDATPAFSSYDMGITFYLGAIYQINDRLGISISPGFTFGMANVWNNPEHTANWSRVIKINTGLIYTLD